MTIICCAIQWIDKAGKPTPDTNEAIGEARCFFVRQPGFAAGYVDHWSEWLPICAHHRARMIRERIEQPAPGRAGWEFRPFKVDGADIRGAVHDPHVGGPESTGVVRDRGRPESGKVYRLTGPDSIASGKTWAESAVDATPRRLTLPDGSLESAVASYCRQFKAAVEVYGVGPEEFARGFRRAKPTAALAVMEEIGSWPSSEPELAALQRLP